MNEALLLTKAGYSSESVIEDVLVIANLLRLQLVVPPTALPARHENLPVWSSSELVAEPQLSTDPTLSY